MLSARLVFGTSRLTGGATAKQAINLIEQCLASNVSWFDTAPSYGLGLAESVVGSALARRPDVRVTVKVGSCRPRFGAAQSWLRLAKSLGRRRSPLLDRGFTPLMPRAVNLDGDFTKEAMLRSLLESLSRLGRSRADLLLLHEAFAGNASVSAIEALAAFQDQGYACKIGYSHGAMFDEATASAFPPDYVTQVGIRPEWLTGTARIPNRSLVLHSIAKTGRFLSKTNLEFAGKLAAMVHGVSTPELNPVAMEIATLFALAHARAPTCALIFTSNDSARLAALLAAFTHVGTQVAAEELLAAFPTPDAVP